MNHEPLQTSEISESNQIRERDNISGQDVDIAGDRNAPSEEDQTVNLPKQKEKNDVMAKERLEDETNILEETKISNSLTVKEDCKYEENTRVEKANVENRCILTNKTKLDQWTEAKNHQKEIKQTSTSAGISESKLPGCPEKGQLPSTNLTSAEFTHLPKLKISSQKFPCFIPRIKQVVSKQQVF